MDRSKRRLATLRELLQDQARMAGHTPGKWSDEDLIDYATGEAINNLRQWKERYAATEASRMGRVRHAGEKAGAGSQG